ncbi:uncharacterized protein LOC123514076 [Portunus trituberculatus]|uniref:uncharacterized protein LOC123514076 n=1 Tax=Portunus trituberculatus TaxID=210409 RepID=UPI001E1CB1E9|nr:uncharacterized protein LOC123514076 [Portunus trituberculatus]
MEVKDGERHVFANLASSTANLDSTGKTSQAHHRITDNGLRVLVNTQMKNPACLQKKQSVNKKNSTSIQGKYNKTSKVPGNLTRAGTTALNTGNVYNEPEIYSTLHVATQLAQTRKMQPNLSQLVKSKLDSPSTNAKLKRQPAKDVNVPKSHSVFQELVSLDVSEGALETQLRNTLNIRADAVRHSQGHQDPVPQPSDIMDPEEYVSRATVTKTTSSYAPSACVQSQKLTREEFCQFSKMVMDLL